ncbi:MAG TPA: acyl-CoA dehydrogenase family protein [Acidimicrobiales bacterium]|nr:acyl-CoA dehydrogenase family protein [Acidimicrobiales bacterium]
MRFGFDERQIEFRNQLRALTEKSCTSAELRAAGESELGWSPARWAALAEMGVVGLTVPESYDGLGFGLVDLVLLLEETGRSGLPEPLLETTALAVPLLGQISGAGAEELRGRWLPKVAAGAAVMAVGTAAMPSVPGAGGADLLLLERDGEIHAVEAAATVRRARRSLDGTRRPAEVSWEPSPATRVVAAEDAQGVLASLADRAAMSTGAVLVGVADRLITMTAEYAVERVQFGKPIGSFQAVKHHLANALIRLEFARPAVYRAAWSLDVGDPGAGWHASMAKALAAEAATGAARMALQVHGAIGYTWEHDLQLWMKRAWSLSAAWGDAGFHRARVLERMLATAKA